MKTLAQLVAEFGPRLTTLHTGAAGLRGGLHCECKEVSGDAPQMDFVATDETIDRYNECIKLSGWSVQNYLANPIVPDCHDYSSIGKILGRTVSLTITGGQMINRVEFCLDNPMGNLAYKMAKTGFLKSESVGFIPLEWTNGNKPGEPDRTYLACELLEISLVVVPANPGATIGAALKSGAIQRADIEGLLQFCSEEKPDPAGNGAPSAAAVPDARLLQLARQLNQVLRRA